MPSSGGKEERRAAWLLLAPFGHPLKDFVAITLGWICRKAGVVFDAYYAAEREGGLFAFAGSPVIGGHHHYALSRFLLRFDTTVVRLGELSLFAPLLDEAPVTLIEASQGLAHLYGWCAAALNAPPQETAIAVQTQDLPDGLRHGIVPYVAAQVIRHGALAAPLELDEREVRNLRALGLSQVWLIGTEDSSAAVWEQAGFSIRRMEGLRADDTYGSFTYRLAERHLDRARGVDFCEPLLASCWLPFCLAEDRLMVCHESTAEGLGRLVPLLRQIGAESFYARYGGGLMPGARNDEDLFASFQAGIACEVVEPTRPPLPVLLRYPTPLPQPARGSVDSELSDEQLCARAEKGKILAALVMHSGEMSHLDAALHIIDLCAVTGVRIGLAVGWRRYAWGGQWVELLQTPPEEGGVMGICEPILHSSGFGILAEHLTDPGDVAALMKEARGIIAEIAGEGFAPRGVYCYLDVPGNRWEERNEQLWQAIKKEGFEFVISSAGFGAPRLLHRDGDFIVLNQCGRSHYPYSPFVRISCVEEMAAQERALAEAGKPGWLLGVLDSPIFGSTPYLSHGDPFGKVRLGELFEYLQEGGATGKMVSVTPHAIARYARLIAD